MLGLTETAQYAGSTSGSKDSKSVFLPPLPSTQPPFPPTRLLPPLQDLSLPIPLLLWHLKPARFIQVLIGFVYLIYIWRLYKWLKVRSQRVQKVLEQIRWKVCPWPMTQLFERQQFTGRVAGGYQQPRQLAPWCLPILGSSQFWDFGRLIRLTRTGRSAMASVLFRPYKSVSLGLTCKKPLHFAVS